MAILLALLSSMTIGAADFMAGEAEQISGIEVVDEVTLRITLVKPFAPFLGFLAIVLPVALTQENTPLSPFLPLIILGFPILDTVTVMTERIADGRSPFVAADILEGSVRAGDRVLPMRMPAGTGGEANR